MHYQSIKVKRSFIEFKIAAKTNHKLKLYVVVMLEKD